MARKSMRERIQDYLEGKIHYADFTLKDRARFDQMRMVEAMWLDGKSDKVIREALFEKFALGPSLARSVMGDTQHVFGDLRKVDRNYQRYRAEQMALRAYEMAELEGDYRAMTSAVKVFIEANGLNNEDPDMPPLEQLQPSVNVLMLPEGMEGMIRQQISEGVVDRTELPQLETLDLEYVEVESK